MSSGFLLLGFVTVCMVFPGPPHNRNGYNHKTNEANGRSNNNTPGGKNFGIKNIRIFASATNHKEVSQYNYDCSTNEDQVIGLCKS